MADNIRDLRNEELVTLLSFAESRQQFFLETGRADSAAASKEKDQNIKDELERRGISAETYKKYPMEGR